MLLKDYWFKQTITSGFIEKTKAKKKKIQASKARLNYLKINYNKLLN